MAWRLYPLSAFLWSIGVADLMRHPDLFRRTVRKQFKIVRKRYRNAQKRRRKAKDRDFMTFRLLRIGG